MGLPPGVGLQRGVVRIAGQQTIEHVLEVGPDIQIVADRAADERQEVCGTVIGRKNWMFAGSENGARNSAVLFSIIVSCKLTGVDPFAYLRDILTRLHTHPADRIGELVPREWKKRFGPQTSPATPAAA